MLDIFKRAANLLKQGMVTLELYFAGKNTRYLIVLFIYFFIIITAILVCTFSIINSDKVLYNIAKDRLLRAAEAEAKKEEQILIKAEKSLDGLSNFIRLTFDTNKFDDLNYVKTYRDKYLFPAVKEFYSHNENIEGMYAYLDVIRLNPKKYVAEAWVTKNKIIVNINKISYTRKDGDMEWYYRIYDNKKPEWIERYWDTDLKKLIISYAKPVYKEDSNQIFIAGTGIDLTSDYFNSSINAIKLYKSGNAFLVTSDYFFIAAKDFTIKDNLFEVKNGYYKPIKQEIEKNISGVYKLKDNLIAYARLYNNYTLLISVSYNEITQPIRNLNILLIGFTLLAIVIATLIMLTLLRRLNKIVDSLEVSDNIIMTIANSIEAKDANTKGHIQRVTSYAVKMAQDFKLSIEEMESLKKASMLHDIGKIGIPDEILNKPGKLSKEEFEVMKNHAIFGSNILKPLNSFKQIIDLVRHHHERLDGSGYPDGLKGDEISLSTRILTVIDIYDALVTERPYKKAFTPEEALAILDEEVAKGYLDKKVLDKFKNILKNYQKAEKEEEA